MFHGTIGRRDADRFVQDVDVGAVPAGPGLAPRVGLGEVAERRHHRPRQGDLSALGEADRRTQLGA